jgi:hypothetical protein
MGIGVSILLIAAGAIMTFAVEVENASGFNINTVGIILMIAGALGLIATLTIFGGRRGDTYVERDVRRDVY